MTFKNKEENTILIKENQEKNSKQVILEAEIYTISLKNRFANNQLIEVDENFRGAKKKENHLITVLLHWFENI